MQISKRIGTGVSAIAIVVGTAVPALATVEHPGGGTWIYGTNRTEVYSKYQHPRKDHRASVINGYGEYRSSGCKKPNVWANASLRAHPDKADEAYWSNSC